MSLPNHVLPTNRVAYEKQKDILKAFAIVGAQGNVTTNKAVSEALTGLLDSTIRFTNEFFVEVGFIRETSGGFVVSRELSEYYIAESTGEESAFHRLGPLLEKTWFAKTLLPKLQVRPLSDGQAITALAVAAGSADREYRGRIRMLLRYMEDAGLIRLDGNTYSPGNSVSAVAEEDRIEEPRVLTTVVSSQPLSKSGGVQLTFSIRVDANEFSSWTPDRIAAFFGGLAQVLAAKATLDQQREAE